MADADGGGASLEEVLGALDDIDARLDEAGLGELYAAGAAAAAAGSGGGGGGGPKHGTADPDSLSRFSVGVVLDDDADLADALPCVLSELSADDLAAAAPEIEDAAVAAAAGSTHAPPPPPATLERRPTEKELRIMSAIAEVAATPPLEPPVGPEGHVVDDDDARARAATRKVVPGLDLDVPDVLDRLDEIRSATVSASVSPAGSAPGSTSASRDPLPGSPAAVAAAAAGAGAASGSDAAASPAAAAPSPKWSAVRPSNSTMARKAQVESARLRMFKVIMPESQGYVTLPFRPDMTLEQVRSAIMRKRRIRLSPSEAFAFQRTTSVVGGQRTIVVPLTLKDFKPPSTDLELPLTYTLDMLVREGHREVAMFIRPEVDPAAVARTPSERIV